MSYNPLVTYPFPGPFMATQLLMNASHAAAAAAAAARFDPASKAQQPGDEHCLCPTTSPGGAAAAAAAAAAASTGMVGLPRLPPLPEFSAAAAAATAAAAAAAAQGYLPHFGSVEPAAFYNALSSAGGYAPCDPGAFPHYSYCAPGYPGVDISGVRRKNATRETTSQLKAWLYEHRKNPYPTKGEKIMLAIITKMTLTQVSTWFANVRRRLKKENKMTWSPKNRSSDGSGAGGGGGGSGGGGSVRSDDDDDVDDAVTTASAADLARAAAAADGDVEFSDQEDRGGCDLALLPPSRDVTVADDASIVSGGGSAIERGVSARRECGSPSGSASSSPSPRSCDRNRITTRDLADEDRVAEDDIAAAAGEQRQQQHSQQQMLLPHRQHRLRRRSLDDPQPAHSGPATFAATTASRAKTGQLQVTCSASNASSAASGKPKIWSLADVATSNDKPTRSAASTHRHRPYEDVAAAVAAAAAAAANRSPWSYYSPAVAGHLQAAAASPQALALKLSPPSVAVAVRQQQQPPPPRLSPYAAAVECTAHLPASLSLHFAPPVTSKPDAASAASIRGPVSSLQRRLPSTP